VVGVIRLDYAGGPTFERHYLDLLDPVGLPIVRMEVPVPDGSTATLVARPQWTAFGELRNTVSAELPPWGFHGQVVAAETAANAPNGSVLQTLRSPLSLNTWRMYDPRVGQYLTPEPMAAEGATRWSAFGYALEAPYDLWDPDGRFISSCTATPSAAAICGAGITGGGALGTGTLGGGARAARRGARSPVVSRLLRRARPSRGRFASRLLRRRRTCCRTRRQLSPTSAMGAPRAATSFKTEMREET
jgi:RHS repeat-associated protein